MIPPINEFRMPVLSIVFYPPTSYFDYRCRIAYFDTLNDIHVCICLVDGMLDAIELI